MGGEALLANIFAIHAEVKGEYGWPKMWKELVAHGHRVGKERERRLMQLHHLSIVPDLVRRNFTMTAPNQVWTGDITYIADNEGWLYLAAVQPSSGGLEHAGAHAKQLGDGRSEDGVVPASSSVRPDLPFGPWQPILRA